MFDLNSGLSVALGSGFLYGVLHGLGPDHCAAVIALSLRAPDAREAMRQGLRVGVSHGIGLSALVLGAVALGVAIPVHVERAFELAGGLVLMVVGGYIALRTDVGLRVHKHDERGRGWHAHFERGTPASLLGGVFAASGSRALVLLLSPMLAAQGRVAPGVAFVLAFATGVMFTMLGCAGLLAVLHRARPDFAGGLSHARVARVTGLLTLLLGLVWAVRALVA